MGFADYEDALGWLEHASCEIYDDESEESQFPSPASHLARVAPHPIAGVDEYSDADAEGEYDSDHSDARRDPISSPQVSRFVRWVQWLQASYCDRVIDRSFL